MLAPALLATASASVYVLYSTRLCYLSHPQLAPIWRIVHSELDTPHTSARRHEGFCIRMHIFCDNIQMCAECLMPNAQSFGSELRIVHSELDTPHTFACHHEGFCIRVHILRDDMQTCAECLMPNAQSFRSELGYRAREHSRVQRLSWIHVVCTLAVARSRAGACDKTVTRSVEIRRSYREFLVSNFRSDRAVRTVATCSCG